MFFIAIVSVFNTVQNFLTLKLTRKIYSRQPQLGNNGRVFVNSSVSLTEPNSSVHVVNPLQSRTFGVWTLTSGLIRLYAAYNIRDPASVNLVLPCVLFWSVVPLSPSSAKRFQTRDMLIRLWAFRLYHLAIGSYCIALIHFVSELFVFKSTALQSGLISPLIVACRC